VNDAITAVTVNPEKFLDFTGKGVEAYFGMRVQELAGVRTREIVMGRGEASEIGIIDQP
jgi:hypothetical protein